MLDYSPNGQNEFVRDVGGLNRADFKKTGGAITYPTEHGTLAILVTKEVYELGPQNGRAVTGDGPAVYPFLDLKNSRCSREYFW